MTAPASMLDGTSTSSTKSPQAVLPRDVVEEEMAPEEANINARIEPIPNQSSMLNDSSTERAIDDID